MHPSSRFVPPRRAPYLLVPGWAGSGPDHWQSHWQRELPGARRVEMPDWHSPGRGDWLAALDHEIAAAPAPPVLIAHSLGCLAVVHWAASATRAIRGALLVAPPDLERPGAPEVLRGFAPMPRARLAFASRLVASDDDPYASAGWAARIARAWGSQLTVLPDAGHINPASGFGRWVEGRALLAALDGEPRPIAHDPELADEPWVCRGVD